MPNRPYNDKLFWLASDPVTRSREDLEMVAGKMIILRLGSERRSSALVRGPSNPV
jgi:hypothetical protein